MYSVQATGVNMLHLLCCVVSCSVEVQLVGDRKNTRVDQRILHLDVAAAALKLVSNKPTHTAYSISLFFPFQLLRGRLQISVSSIAAPCVTQC